MKGMSKESGARLFLVVSSEEEAQTEIQVIPFNHEKRKAFFTQTPEQIARQVVESTTLGDTQNPKESGPEQSALTDLL